MKRGLYTGEYTVWAVPACQYAEVGDTKRLKRVQLFLEAGHIPSSSFGSQNWTIPEISTDKRIGLAVSYELTIFYSYEIRCWAASNCADNQEQ